MSDSTLTITHTSSAPSAVSHPSASDGSAMALAAIMKCLDATNGLAMAWDESTANWGAIVSGQSTQMNADLKADYDQLVTDVNNKAPEHTITEDQLKYNQDQTKWQNNMQQTQSELDKESQSVKDLGTSTQSLMTNTSSLLGIQSNLSQMMGRG